MLENTITLICFRLNLFAYDWRGMPVEFKRQNACYDIHEKIVCASTRLTLDYDGSGRRISKTVWRKAAGESGWTKDNVTHYTGIGTEVRENFAGSTPGAKVVVSLPEGLGRYAPGDASENADARPLKDENGNELAGMLPGTNFEWFLKNHLGSIMLVFGTQSTASPDASDNGTLKAAYDYHAFGEQQTLVEPTDKVTENFTGKGIRGERCDSRVYSSWHCRAEEHCAQRNERDDEIELNYFGARYLDPMLGLWVSVDPARQFSSPYLYAGNGMNPVNVVDGDGNAACIQKIGNNVNVTIPVTFNGSASNRENINLVKKIVAQHFTGEFGKYNLKTSVVEYNEKIHNRNNIVTLEPNIISFLDKNQINPQHAYINMNSDRNILHEFAHLMGLDDKYYHDFMNIRGKNGLPYPGYESNLMGGC
ncbi:MAG: hypothetical protein MJZ22_03690 [Candidatus Saccharibacteria bacterium]|nr:hypothetical protein [Candidatus Saccharibacteria bacterium]